MTMKKPEPGKPILLGMHRPPWDELMQAKRPFYWTCPGCGEVLSGTGDRVTPQMRAREHWQMGHFDEPVYVGKPNGYGEPPKDRPFEATQSAQALTD